MEGKVTKRKALQIIASICDPLELLTSSTLKGKLFFQSLWKEKCNWDEKLSEKEVKEFENICKNGKERKI